MKKWKIIKSIFGGSAGLSRKRAKSYFENLKSEGSISPLIIILTIPFVILILAFFIKYLFLRGKRQNKLLCPIRGNINSKELDTKENYSEEYQRISLIKFFLKEGFEKTQIFVDYSIPLGHKGKRSLIVDLIVRKKNSHETVLVAEVKKNYSESTKKSAIQHQLIPAMLLLRCNIGIYFDGSSKSCLVITQDNGEMITKPLVISN